MPVGNVLVGDPRGNIKHDDTALSVDVVTITKTTELLLTSGIPDVELNLAKVGVEPKGAISRTNQPTENGEMHPHAVARLQE